MPGRRSLARFALSRYDRPGPTMAQEPALDATAPPGSQALLDVLLQNLYDFGEYGPSEPTWRADLSSPELGRPPRLKVLERRAPLSSSDPVLTVGPPLASVGDHLHPRPESVERFL